MCGRSEWSLGRGCVDSEPRSSQLAARLCECEAGQNSCSILIHLFTWLPTRPTHPTHSLTHSLAHAHWYFFRAHACTVLDSQYPSKRSRFLCSRVFCAASVCCTCDSCHACNTLYCLDKARCRGLRAAHSVFAHACVCVCLSLELFFFFSRQTHFLSPTAHNASHLTR